MTDTVSADFYFFGTRKTLPQGEYKGMIVGFFTTQKTSKAGKPYHTLSMKVDIDGQEYVVNMSLNPKEEGKTTNKLIKQLALFKPEAEILDLTNNPKEFMDFAVGKPVKLVVDNDKGYFDVFPASTAPIALNKPSSQDIDPDSIPEFI